MEIDNYSIIYHFYQIEIGLFISLRARLSKTREDKLDGNNSRFSILRLSLLKKYLFYILLSYTQSCKLKLTMY